jgi:hypothetical protein
MVTAQACRVALAALQCYRYTFSLVHRENVGNVGIGLCLTSVDMTKTVPLTSLVSLFLAGPVVAGDSRHPAGDAPAAADDEGKQTEPAECPIKKTIDGKTYCFHNDPALAKRQGGG